MTVAESIKKVVQQVTGAGRPDRADLRDLVRERKGSAYRFLDDGIIPNHPKWPLIVYKSVIKPAKTFDAAAVIEVLFAANGWAGSWRNGSYDYVHYHSRIHEVLGVARGKAKVQFGGLKGRTLVLAAGDIAILPAGTGHQCLEASENFLVVGAYPQEGTYDECTKSEDHKAAVLSIPKVPRPIQDPVYGSKGTLRSRWRK